MDVTDWLRGDERTHLVRELRSTERTRMTRVVSIVIVVCGLPCFGWAGSRPETHRKKLAAPTDIQGFSCAKGWAWFYSDDHLERCTVAGESAFGEAKAPAGSIIVLRKDGKPDHVFLSHDWTIVSYKCKGGGILGPSEGAATSFFPSGKLKLCWLAGDQEIQGIPCMDAAGLFGTIIHHGGAEVRFYDTGKLHSCTLSQDHGDLKKGERFTQPRQ